MQMELNKKRKELNDKDKTKETAVKFYWGIRSNKIVKIDKAQLFNLIQLQSNNDKNNFENNQFNFNNNNESFINYEIADESIVTVSVEGVAMVITDTGGGAIDDSVISNDLNNISIVNRFKFPFFLNT